MTASSPSSEPAAARSPPRNRRALVTAVLLGGVLGALLALLVGEPARRTLFDGWQRAAPRTISADRVAVVLIDPESLAVVGPWPWPRYYLARLTEAIARGKPKAIGFDMIFPEHDPLDPDRFAALYPELAPTDAAALGRLPSMDAVFAQVLGSAPAVLGRLGLRGDGSDPAQLFVDPEIAGRPPRGTPNFRQVLVSIPELEDVALGHAMLNGPPDDDGIVRRVPLTVEAGGRAMPGLAVELARIVGDVPALAWRGGRLALGRRLVPADDAGQVALRFGRFPARATFGASRVIAGAVPAGAFAGKAVLVGLGAEGTADLVATPLETEGYGVFVQAQATEALLGRHWLQRPRWLALAEWAAGGLLVLLVALGGITRSRWLVPVVLASMVALPLASWLAFDRANHLFDPIRPILMALGAVLALQAVLFVRARAERTRLAAELVNQRIESALQEGELQAARTIQLGMVPGSDRLAALDPRVEVGAVLRPARSVGGDFYDAIRVDPDRLLFVIGDVTGKGVPAALYMALSKALTKSVLIRERGSLAHTVATLNRELLREGDEAMGVTMLIIVLACASGELTMVNAGHENPIVLRADGSVATLAMDGGPPFCVCDFPYPEERARLAPGDTLVGITDGVTEAQDAAGALFGPDAAREAVRRAGAGDAPALVEALAAEVRAWEAETEPSDDLTILAIRWLGTAAG